jgi:hypothetical protein
LFINDGVVCDDDGAYDGGVFDRDDGHAQPFFDGGGELFSQQVEDGDDGRPSRSEEGKNKQPSQQVFHGPQPNQVPANEQHMQAQPRKSAPREKFYISF